MDLKKNPKNTELVKKEEIPNTPFTIVEINNEYFGVMGQYRLTEISQNKEEIKKELESINWTRIIQIILILIEKQK